MYERVHGPSVEVGHSLPINSAVDGIKLRVHRLMKSDFSMHLIPLNSTLSLPATLTVFHQQLLQKKSSNPRASVKEQRSILATCSITGKDMKEHTVNVLCDVCHGFQDLAEWSTTKDGQKAIREYVPDRAELESALGFWNEEWIAE